MNRYLKRMIIVFGVLSCYLGVVKINTIYAAERTVNSSMTTAQIQSVLDTNKSNSNQTLTVKFEGGNYCLDATLFVYSNTVVKADSNAVFKLESNTYKTMIGSRNFQEGTDNYDKGGYVNESNITIDGGKWDGNGKSGEMVRFIHGTNITVKNMEVYNIGEGGHLITFAGVKDGWIENCKLHGYLGKEKKEAIHLDIVHDGSMVPGTDKYDDATNQNIIITGNTVYDYPRAVGSHAAVDGVYQRNIQVNNNRFYNLSEEAVKFYGFKDSSVTNNSITNVGIGVRVYTYLEGTTYVNPLSSTKKEAQPSRYNINVQGNVIQNCSQYGIQTRGLNSRIMRGVTIKGNKISSTAGTGIMMYNYTSNCTVSENTISNAGNQGVGVYYASNGNTILNNTISDSKVYGVYLGGTGNTTIKSNNISRSKNHGICMGNNSHSTLIQSNKIVSSGGNGTSINGSKNVIVRSNQITSSKNTGVALNSKCEYAYVAYNTINGAKNKGIAVYSGGTKAKINGNSLKNVSGVGIYVQKCSKPKVYNNTIQLVGKNPITIDKCKSANISTLKNEVGKITRKTKKILGKSTKKGKVYIIISKKKYVVKADKKGKFKKNIKKQKKGTKIYFSFKDGGENKTYKTVSVK
ncbi:MAG: right-handed parallel beta-helix repeat-containing protein [Anaerostipes sp.]|nr:right-handed parallel beta-helix repeat-containing protein [Anaerostipes sp.]